MMKQIFLRITPALFVSVLWFLPYRESVRELAALILIFVGACAAQLCENRIHAFAAALLFSAAVGVTNFRYLFFCAPGMLLPVCFPSPPQEKKTAGKAGNDPLCTAAFFLFCGFTAASWVFMFTHISSLYPALLPREPKFWLFPLLFVLYLYKAVAAVREEKKDRTKTRRKKSAGFLIGESAICIAQLVFLVGVFFLTAEGLFPVRSCLFAPALSAYLLFTDPKTHAADGVSRRLRKDRG